MAIAAHKDKLTALEYLRVAQKSRMREKTTVFRVRSCGFSVKGYCGGVPWRGSVRQRVVLPIAVCMPVGLIVTMLVPEAAWCLAALGAVLVVTGRMLRIWADRQDAPNAKGGND